MSEKYDFIIVNLKVIAQVPRNRRLKSTADGYFTLENNDIWVPIRRKIFGEGRNKLVRDLKSFLLLIESQLRLLIAKHIEDIQKPENEASNTTMNTKLTSLDEKRLVAYQLSCIFRELHRSITGFEGLKATYEADILMVGELENIMERVRLLKDEIEEKYPDVGENISPVQIE
jgi:hypothetical protein